MQMTRDRIGESSGDQTMKDLVNQVRVWLLCFPNDTISIQPQTYDTDYVDTKLPATLTYAIEIFVHPASVRNGFTELGKT